MTKSQVVICLVVFILAGILFDFIRYVARTDSIQWHVVNVLLLTVAFIPMFLQSLH